MTCLTAYAPFTPSYSGQRSPPTSYRGCWHVVSRDFSLGTFLSSIPASLYSPNSEVYIPKDFFLHAASLDQTFVHCPKFPTAASRRSRTRVSVPLWPIMLSHRLSVVGLVGLYPTNYLMEHRSLIWLLFPL